ncbi:transposase [Streptomyces vinaceus]
MADKDEAATSAAGDKTIDEVVQRLLGKADASGTTRLSEDGLLTEITRAVLVQDLDAGVSGHRGYECGDPAGHGEGNSRNGTSPKTVLAGAGTVTLAVPRGRSSKFELRPVPKSARRLAGFNDRIPSLFARGMSVRGIRSHLTQIYEVQVSPTCRVGGRNLPALTDPCVTVSRYTALVVLFVRSSRLQRCNASVRTCGGIAGRSPACSRWLSVQPQAVCTSSGSSAPGRR